MLTVLNSEVRFFAKPQTVDAQFGRATGLQGFSRYCPRSSLGALEKKERKKKAQVCPAVPVPIKPKKDAGKFFLTKLMIILNFN